MRAYVCVHVKRVCACRCVCTCVCVYVLASQMSWSRGPGSRLVLLLKSMTSAKPLNLCQMEPSYLPTSPHRGIVRINRDNGCGNGWKGRDVRPMPGRVRPCRAPLWQDGRLAHLDHPHPTSRSFPSSHPAVLIVLKLCVHHRELWALEI